MTHRRSTLLAAVLLTLAASGCGPARDPAVPAGSAQVRCTNTSSGAAWTIAVDEARARVDGHAADIDGQRLTWRDEASSTNYELDRRDGRLIVNRPSSTGGWMMFDWCKAG